MSHLSRGLRFFRFAAGDPFVIHLHPGWCTVGVKAQYLNNDYKGFVRLPSKAGFAVVIFRGGMQVGNGNSWANGGEAAY